MVLLAVKVFLCHFVGHFHTVLKCFSSFGITDGWTSTSFNLRLYKQEDKKFGEFEAYRLHLNTIFHKSFGADNFGFHR